MPMTHVSWGDFNAGDKVSWKTVTTNNGSILCWDVSNWFSERRGRLEREQERSRCCFVVNTFYDLSPDHTGETFLLVLNISVEIWPFFFKKNLRKTYEEIKWIVENFQYFECGLLASSPACFFECNLIQFDVDRDLNLNIIAKKRHGATWRKTSHIHLSTSSSQLCFDWSECTDKTGLISLANTLLMMLSTLGLCSAPWCRL